MGYLSLTLLHWHTTAVAGAEIKVSSCHPSAKLAGQSGGDAHDGTKEHARVAPIPSTHAAQHLKPIPLAPGTRPNPAITICQPSRINPSIRTIAPHARSTTPAPNLGPTGVGAAATLRPSLPHHWSLGAVFLMTSKAWTLNKCAGLVVEAAEVPDGGAADGRRHPCPWRRATHTAPPSGWVDGPARARPPEPNFSRSTCS